MMCRAAISCAAAAPRQMQMQQMCLQAQPRNSVQQMPARTGGVGPMIGGIMRSSLKKASVRKLESEASSSVVDSCDLFTDEDVDAESGDDLEDLVNLQGSSGKFGCVCIPYCSAVLHLKCSLCLCSRWGPALERLLGAKSESDIASKKPTGLKDANTWLTLVVVALLQLAMGEKKDMWELVAEKAMKFVQKELGKETEKMEEEAKKVVEEMLKQKKQ